MAAWTLPAELSLLIGEMTSTLHGRNAWRFVPLLIGMLFARGRRTVASWLRGGGIGKGYQGYYYFLGSLGRKVRWLAALLLRQALQRIGTGDRLLFAIDDTPTKRYGPKVEGAGIHRNPTPGPAQQKYVYGHVWVTLAWVVRHGLWGTIGLPLLACLYVRQGDIGSIAPWYKVQFETKLQQAAGMVEWLASWLQGLGKPVWVVVDGAYVKEPFLKRAEKAGVTVVGRLRRDAALRSVPRLTKTRQRGRPRKYGSERISLAKRAGHRQGWTREVFTLYGKETLTRYKTFLATYKPAGGLIRVVLVQNTDGWKAYMCTDPDASVAEILEAVADRGAIEQNFHDLKEVHGAGQQQLRNYWANIAAYHLSLWLHTMIELWAWFRPKAELCDRSRSPWDDPNRRPSHADRRNTLRRSCLLREFSAANCRHRLSREFRTLFNDLLQMVA